MRFHSSLLSAAVLIGAAAPAAIAQGAPAAPTALEVGAVAPDFTLRAATRFGVLQSPVRLSDLKGKTVVLAFFPKARTSGCTIQMHTYRDQYAKLFRGGRGVVLMAISMDQADTLAAWAHDDEMPQLFVSDTGAVVAKLYGANGSRFDRRYLYVIGPDGKISYRATPFHEADPTSYTDLSQAIGKFVPADSAAAK